jgi:D-methionine transport system permease protein
MTIDLGLAFTLLPKELLNTCYMVFSSGLLALLLGIPLGVALILTRKGGLKESKILYKALSFCVDIGRSVPFAILIVAMIPVTRVIMGTSIGTTASILPLTVAAIPFVARIVELSLSEIDIHLIEAALVMGSTTRQIVTKLYLPEALPSLVSGTTLTLVNLVGYSAMAGLVGGGGLGKIAIQYGYQRFNGFLMFTTLLLLVLLVMGIQMVGNKIVHHILSRRGKLC